MLFFLIRQAAQRLASLRPSVASPELVGVRECRTRCARVRVLILGIQIAFILAQINPPGTAAVAWPPILPCRTQEVRMPMSARVPHRALTPLFAILVWTMSSLPVGAASVRGQPPCAGPDGHCLSFNATDTI